MALLARAPIDLLVAQGLFSPAMPEAYRLLSRLLVLLAAALATAVMHQWPAAEHNHATLHLFTPHDLAHLEGRALANDAGWYQGIVDQTIASSLMHRYGTIAEQVAAILFLASDDAAYITGVTLPVGGGDLG